ncbi:hypothetical protein ACQJBY_046012 [Aegilops geniculata]
MSWRELGLDLEAWQVLELLLVTPSGCCELPFPSSSWRTDDGGPAVFAAPAPPLPLLLLLPARPGQRMSSGSKASSADGLQGTAAAPKLWPASLL